MTFYVENEVDADFGFDIEELAKSVADTVLDMEGCAADIEVGLTITDSEGIHELNKEFRGIDAPTDVLSFPQFDDLADIDQKRPYLLGDVVLCTAQAERQAEEYGHSVDRELVYLFVHSMCHLVGYDHMEEDEKAVMRAREEEVLSAIGVKRKK